MDSAKIASVRPIFKKGERTEIKNYRPVSILNCFSKIYERFLHNQISSFSNEFLSDFISAYRKGCSTNHVLIRLNGNWKTSLDKNLFTGAVLMDLSKAFDCIPHDLLIGKLHAYGRSFSTVTYDRLRFDQHTSNLCFKAAMQWNALSWLQEYMGISEKVAIINSFIYTNFNYCPLAWHFSTCESIRKIEKIQKRCLRIVLDNYGSDYDVLLRKNGKVTMEMKRLRILAIEIFKTVQTIWKIYSHQSYNLK